MPHLTEDTLAGVRGEPKNDAERVTRALSDELLAELRAADIIVIGAPMYNFGVATSLRAWFDHVLRAGETFRYSEAGPKGLLSGKCVIVVESRGFYSEGPSKAVDFQEPYLSHLLGFMGLTDVTFVRARAHRVRTRGAGGSHRGRYVGFAAGGRTGPFQGALNVWLKPAIQNAARRRPPPTLSQGTTHATTPQTPAPPPDETQVG